MSELISRAHTDRTAESAKTTVAAAGGPQILSGTTCVCQMERMGEKIS